MAQRVVPADVRLILSTELEDAQVEAFILQASLWIDTFLVPSCDLSDKILERIEANLAAHMIGAREPRVTSAKLQDMAVTYGKDEGSQYARQAAALDPCGIIRQHFLGEKRAAYAVGKGFNGGCGC